MISRRAFVRGVATCAFFPGVAPLAFADEEQFIKFFTGRIVGKGTIDNFRSGERRGIAASIVGKQSSNTLVLTQNFEFSDGQRERKVWSFKRTEAGIVGHRADVNGEGVVTIAGNQATLSYNARTPVDGSTYNLKFDEHLNFMSTDQVENVTTIKWSLLSIPVGEIRLSMRKT